MHPGGLVSGDLRTGAAPAGRPLFGVNDNCSQEAGRAHVMEEDLFPVLSANSQPGGVPSHAPGRPLSADISVCHPVGGGH